MKAFLLFLILFLVSVSHPYCQITTPVIKANFGVDADLRSNYFNNFVQSGNDDWFRFPGSTGTGQFIIDTTGAAAIVAGYNSNMALRRLPFYRGMRYPGFTVVNNRLLLDAVMIRDYHGDDSTVFASGANKNGDSPVDWNCPVSQGIPDKNDILDMMVHVRRAGPNKTDSLWMFGGLSLDNTTGNRYFDFEMYQTDIYYDRGSRKFYGYGPDAGHTSWQFDAAGNITVPGDIIFSAEYQSSALSLVEARIWVHRSALSITPSSFDWSGDFDGASSGATYGYANIRPKTTGAYYTGLQCANNTWAGPFAVVLQNESLVTEYDAKQFVEFSVNLTKLGLDPVTLLGSNTCGMPFRRILVKTRSSASFTAELKDFVGPFDFFLAPRVQIQTSTPYICEQSSVAEINVINPVATSFYTWITTDGNIISGSTGPTIYVNKPGTYIVTQYLQEGCSTYAADTIQVYALTPCQALSNNKVVDFHGKLVHTQLRLDWKVQDNQQVQFFEVQKSSDGINFTTVGEVSKLPSGSSYNYQMTNESNKLKFYYRIKLINTNNTKSYSALLKLSAFTAGMYTATIYPNPVRNEMYMQVLSPVNAMMQVDIYDVSGKQILSISRLVQEGVNAISFEETGKMVSGMYVVVTRLNGEFNRQKILINK
jgi:hypothetical protein